MLFSEVYGTYFQVLAAVLEQAAQGKLTGEQMYSIIREKGFEESILTIPRNLEDQTWPLLKEDLSTPLKHRPTQPVTTLQKRWMKTLLADPRIRLFVRRTLFPTFFSGPTTIRTWAGTVRVWRRMTVRSACKERFTILSTRSFGRALSMCSTRWREVRRSAVSAIPIPSRY